MKKYKDLNLLINRISNVLFQKSPNGYSKGQKKLELIVDVLKTHIEKMNSMKNAIYLNNAHEVDGVLAIGKNQEYLYSKEGAKQRDKDLEDLMESEFAFNKIQISRPEGLENYIFLKDWVEGIVFEEEETL